MRSSIERRDLDRRLDRSATIDIDLDNLGDRGLLSPVPRDL
jgi:hypothetical protein